MIEFRNVSIKFSSDNIVVDNIDLNVEEGKKTVIIGESGSGKSVLMLSALKLLPQNAFVEGSIVFKGKNLLDLDEKEMQKIRGSEIAYIPQGNGNGLNPLLTIGYQVSEAILEHTKKMKKEAWKRSLDLLKELKLGNEERLIKNYPYMLSGGMKQRVLIACGIAAEADVLFMDEPTKGLDNERVDAVVEILEKLKDKTILCVTHDLIFAERIADYICVIYKGQVVEFSNANDFFKNPLHPYSKAMVDALPKNGMKFKHNIILDDTKNGCKYYKYCVKRNNKCLKMPSINDLSKRKVRCHIYADEM